MLNERQSVIDIMPSSISKMQQKVICHNKGPARVIAGPGSGKTFTIIQRIKYLISQVKVPPEQILCITFTKAAALEMKERYQKHVSLSEEAGNVCFSTVHGICYHILKESGEFRQYSLIKEKQKRDIMKALLENMGLHDDINDAEIEALLYAIGREKNGLSYREEESMSICQFKEVCINYGQILSERRLLDFDDMMTNALSVLTTNERLRYKWQHQFAYLMTDEFQDINQTQYRLIKLLAEPHNNLLVVGDDDQAIYGFRGAAPDIMKCFTDDFPMAECMYLTENFRSGNEIVTFSEKIIRKNRNRFDKNIIAVKAGGSVNICYEETRKEEEVRLLEDIRKLSKEELQISAIIVRTNREVIQYTRLLKAHHIPVSCSDDRNREEIKDGFIKEDFDSFLKFCKEGRKRLDFLTIMNKPEMFLSRQSLVNDIVTQEDLCDYYKENEKMKTKLKQFFAHVKKAENMSSAMAICYFRNIMGYERYLQERAASREEYQSFLNMADELQQLYKKKKNRECCDDFWLRINQELPVLQKKEKQQRGISIITMHGAKGLEYKHVFLPDINEGVIPAKQCKNKESIEEERRLLYVAVTRAKETLHIYYTKERGRKISRFIEERL